jgi:hypothetical protein
VSVMIASTNPWSAQPRVRTPLAKERPLDNEDGYGERTWNH